MRTLTKIILLCALSLAIELVFIGVYYYEATGPLADTLHEHYQTLSSGQIPAASSIDIENDAWVKVAHFESTFYNIRWIVDTLAALLFAWLMIWTGLSLSITAWTRRLTHNVHLSRALYLIGFTALFTLINVPVGVSSYIIETLRGAPLMTPDYLLFSTAQNFVIGALFALLTYVPFYWIIDRYAKWWWAVGAVFMSVFMVFTSYVSPILIDPLYYQLTPLENAAVKEEMQDVLHAAGVSLDDVYVSDASAVTFESNAMVTGIWGTKRIILDDTLITYFTPREIRTIVAHELGHYVLGHMWHGMVLMALMTFVEFFLLLLVMRWIIRRYGHRLHVRHINDITLFPILSVVLVAVLPLILAPVFSLQSRALEQQADAYEVAIAQDPQASIDGFKKMSYQSFVDVDPPKLFQLWFGTHPTVKERIRFYQNQL